MIDDYYSIRYYDKNSLLVINRQGKLRRIYTPFRVVRETPEGKRQWFVVDEVHPGADSLLYLINGRPYSHNEFRIEIHF